MKRCLIDPIEKLSMPRQCQILEVSRGSLYYQPKGAGYERVCGLMRKAAIMPIYPRWHLTQLGEKKYIHPYLLKDLAIDRPNQVWAIDITYVPMANVFLYMMGIIDAYSRFIVGWGLFNTLDAKASLEVIKQSVATHGKPEILNSDQGAQFTCAEYIEYLKNEKIRISMMVKDEL